MVTVKICGVRSEAGADALEAAGADFAGLVRVPGRRRTVPRARVPAVLARLRRTRPIAVVIDAELDALQAELQDLGIQWVQLHGREPPEYALALKRRGLKVVKALSGAAPITAEQMQAYAPAVEALLVDGAEPGSGRRVSIANLPAPGSAPVPLWLAGGLSPQNVAAAARETACAGVDVASGVERGGEPDPDLIRAFVAEARSVQNR